MTIKELVKGLRLDALDVGYCSMIRHDFWTVGTVGPVVVQDSAVAAVFSFPPKQDPGFITLMVGIHAEFAAELCDEDAEVAEDQLLPDFDAEIDISCRVQYRAKPGFEEHVTGLPQETLDAFADQVATQHAWPVIRAKLSAACKELGLWGERTVLPLRMRRLK